MDETSKAIGELVAETRNVGARLDRIEETLTGRLADLEARTRKLELWRSYLAGAWAVVAGGLAYLFAK